MQTIRKNYLVLAAISTLVVVGCGSKSSKTKNDEVAAKIESVRTAPIQKEEMAKTLEFTSTLMPYEEVNLAPSQPGQIDKISAKEGDRVKAGQLLIKMDPTNLLTTKIQLANYKIELDRAAKLRETGSVSQQVYDQTKMQYDLTKTNLEFLEKNVYIKAPFSGVISAKNYEDGELYSGSPGASGKAAILTLIQIDNLKALVNIPEGYYPLVKQGMTVDVMTDIYNKEVFSGSILRVYPTIDSNTRTFQIELKVNNQSLKLRPGMFCRTSIDLGKTEALVVPYQTVLKMQGSNDRYIFIVRNNVAIRVAVTLGKRYDELVEIISSEIQEGDMIVTAGQGKLMSGSKVSVKQ